MEKHRATVLKSEATTVFPTPLSSAVLLAWPAPDKKFFGAKRVRRGAGLGGVIDRRSGGIFGEEQITRASSLFRAAQSKRTRSHDRALDPPLRARA